VIGRRLGRYLVTDAIGRGGMASVWRARDELLGRDVALKVLAESLRAEPEARRRFRHEAEVAASLHHPSVAPVFGSGEEPDGTTWLAMELIEGETLAERLSRSLLPVPEAVRIVALAARALGHAHAHGVVHRDVTSRNVMVGPDGRVVVLDFGLALVEGKSRVTSSRTTVGTVNYMAPELLLGRDADARSDLYSLGCVLYETLTGAPPFRAESIAAVSYAVLNQDPAPPGASRPEVGPELDRVVMRLLARDPARRPASAAALVAELEALAGGGARAAAAGVPSAAGAGAAAGAAAAAPRAYLVVPRFAGAADGSRDAPLAMALAAAVRADLARPGGVRVVVADDEIPDEGRAALRDYARRHGANRVLHGTLRSAGTRVRITLGLFDSERATQVDGETVEGSSLEPFDLEDRVVGAARRLLGAGPEALPAAARDARPDPAPAEHFHLALRYLVRHDDEAAVDGAIALLERLVAHDAGNARGLGALARACQRKHDLTKLRGWSERAADLAARGERADPDEPEVQLALGEVCAAAGRAERAERAFRAVLARDPGRLEALIGLARIAHDAGRHDEAEALCQRAIEANPADWRGHSRLGMLRFERGRYASALEPWRRVVELTPDNARGERNLGNAYFHLDRWDEALAAYRHAIALKPEPLTYTNLGTLLFYMGRHAEAAQAFEKAVALREADPGLWGNLGSALRRIPGEEPRAREALERAVGLARERMARGEASPEMRARMASWLSNLGRRADALAALRAALEHGADNAHVMVHAGRVFLENGEREEGLRWIERALRAGYGPEALRRDPDLERLRADPGLARLLDCGAPPAGAAPDTPATEGGAAP